VAVTLNKVTKTLPFGRVLLQDATLGIYEGAKVGVIGVNGSGKSSLMKIIAGLDTEFEGEVRLAPGLRVGYLPQEPQLDEERSVLENVLDGVRDKLELLQRYEALPAQDPERPALERRLREMRALDLRRRVERAMEALRCPPGDSGTHDLSGGERRRVALCRLLISAPDVLLLDEPTNHLDTASVAWLERFLQEYRGAVMCVTHDRYFLDNIAAWILELDRGRALPFRGNYTEWLEAKEKRLDLERRKEAQLQKTIRTELEWVRSAPRARQAKNKARLDRYEALVRESRQARRYEAGQIVIPAGPRLGKLVLEARGLEKSLGGRLLFRDLSFRIDPGALVGVVGPNGSGKTTLFRLVAGEEEPDRGQLRLGESVRLGYASQVREEDLDPEKTVFEEVAEGDTHFTLPNGDEISIRQFLAAFHFRGDAQETLIGSLSGGERNRVQLAKVLRRAPNFLLLDEPTNDLDLEVLRNLEAALQEFPGAAMVISHDRWFLDRIATHILAFEGDGQVVFFEGNYAEYEKDRRARRGDAPDPTKRPKFTRLGI
jgi:ATP-binding cassette ChvD family protein